MSADALFASLPGAPPADDAQAWAPASSPGGLAPDAAPFVARAVDVSTLTADQQHQFRQVIRSGSQADYQAFLNSLSGQPAAPNTASPPAQLVPPPAGDAVPPEPGFEPDAPRERKELAVALEAHGSSIEALDALEEPMAKFAERMAALASDEARHAALVAGDDEVLRAVYRGSEGGMRAGLAEIKDAATLLDLDLAAIDESGILADPSLHLRVLGMAKAVLANRKA